MPVAKGQNRGSRQHRDERSHGDSLSAKALGDQFSQALAGELLIALGMGVGNAAVFKMVPKYVPEAVGGAAGIVGGLGALGGFIIPPFLGAVVDTLGTQGYAGGFFAYDALAVMAIGVSGYFYYLDRRSKKLDRAVGAAAALEVAP